MKITVEYEQDELESVEILNCQDFFNEVVDREMTAAARKVQAWLHLRKSYAMSGAMRWDNSQEAWMWANAQQFHIGELT